MLRVRHAVPADALAGEVGNGGDVARGPGIRHGLFFGTDPQVGAGADAAALLDGQVSPAHDGRVRHDAGGPHDQVGRDDLAGRELDVAVDGAGHLRVEVHVRAPLGEVLQHPLARLQRHLGHDPAHRLDQVEVRVLEAQLRVVLQQRGCQGAHLGEHLDAGEAATDDHDGQQSVALGTGGQVRRTVEVRQDAVADRDGLFDRLQPDGVVGDAGDRERARDGTGGHDDLVVALLPRLADLRRDGRGAVGVVDARDLRRDHARLLQVTTQPHDRVARLDLTGGDLGKERLIRHVGQRVDDRDLCLALAQVLLELPCGVETGVATADDEDLGSRGADRAIGSAGRCVSHRWKYSLDGRLGVRGARSDLMRRAAAVTPSATSIAARVPAMSGTVP